MSGLGIFGWVTLLSIAVLVLLFGSLFIYTFYGKSLNPMSHPEEVQALAAFLSVILGTAAAVGGAVATLQVANLGLQISSQQDTRDVIHFAEERTTKSVRLFSELLVSLGEVYASGLILNEKIPTIDKSKIEEEMARTIGSDLLGERNSFVASLGSLRAALREIALDEFSSFCLVNSAKNMRSKIMSLNKDLSVLNVPDSSLGLSPSNLSGLSLIIEVARRRLSEETLRPYIQSRLFTNSASVFDMEYDNASVRTLFFIGNLIFSYTNDEREDLFIASYGSAIIHDLFYIVPNGEKIKECAFLRYKDVLQDNLSLDVHFDPNIVIDDSLKFSLEGAEKIGNLYLLHKAK